MKRVHCIVEGQTEVKVFYSILVPYIQNRIAEYVDIVITPIKHSGGGIVHYSKLWTELRNHLLEKDKIVTTFFDYYGLLEKHEFPRYKEAKAESNTYKAIEFLESGISEDLRDKGINVKNFVPYIQLHEFEALLFSSNDGFDYQYDDENILRELKSVLPKFTTPEDINDSPVTAPSKRIISILSNNGEKYNKVIDGETIATIVGIEKMMEKCPRFKEWVELLIQKIKE